MQRKPRLLHPSLADTPCNGDRSSDTKTSRGTTAPAASGTSPSQAAHGKRYGSMSSECESCDHNRRHGWNGLPTSMSHCRRCHQEWSGTSVAHCPDCCRSFSTAGVFDRAHVYRKTRKCWSDQTLKRRGYRKMRRKHGDVWIGPGSKPVDDLSREPLED